ncbi:MAG: acyltransferase family protein, partial [Saprospiraceae bacterium]|nr:acyltransferase family protein [Saprospiraceae bacterium]
LTVFICNRYINGEDVSLLYYISPLHLFGFGPMWFVEALLIFTFVYVLWKMTKVGTHSISMNAPSTRSILIFALLLGLGQFVIRIWLPVGWSMPFTNFQLPHFLQYIFLFAFGLVAYENQWLDTITPIMGWRWFVAVQLLILVGFPLIFVLGGAAELGPEAFMGGFGWRNLVYALWEQVVGIGMIVALLGIFKSRFNTQGILAKRLSASAYGVYVFHAPLIVLLSAIFLSFNIPQIWKFVVLSPVALLLCFGFAFLLKKLPMARKVF